MHTIDWLIMILPLAICAYIAIYTRRYVRGVADFMAGGRNAGRYLICTARSEQGSGAAVFVQNFQTFMVAGFALSWWGQLNTPIGLLLMVTGFVIYRYRQTRAMTLGQFFEMRYSRSFRLFAGMLGFFAGLVNFGVIPAVGARFMVAFLRLPQAIDIAGFQIPTFLFLMAVFLTMCVVMTTVAGQVSVLLTDCAEGMFSQIFYTIIAIVLLVHVFDLATTQKVMLDTLPGKSMVNPFDTSKVQDFNIWLVLMGIFSSLYRIMSWQNSHAFNSSASTPHESRMGGVLGRWRNFAAGVMVTLLSVCAMTYFKTHEGQMNHLLNQIQDPATRDQMKAPIALTEMLPTGIKGMLLSICLMGIIAGDGIHLHSWGSIFIQDVVVPLRQKRTKNELSCVFLVLGLLWCVAGILAGFYMVSPAIVEMVRPDSNPALASAAGHTPQAVALIVFCVAWPLLFTGIFKAIAPKIFKDGPLTPQEHVSLLRWSIVGVAVWAFVFGAMFPQTKYIGFWWSITEAIFIGGAGIAITGGLYWSRGTSAGAWSGLIVGSGLSLIGIGMQVFYEQYLGRDFFLNGPQIGFFASITACIVYGVVSVATCRKPHNMDKLLNRGAYAVEPESEVDASVHPGAAGAKKVLEHSAAAIGKPKKPNWFYRIVTFGIDEQFSRTDRWITIGITLWSMFWFAVFGVGTIVYLVSPWSNTMWMKYWLWTAVYLPLGIGTVTTIWFTWGCTHDMIIFFRRLREETVDVHDDGSVVHEDEARVPVAIALGSGESEKTAAK